VSELTTRGDYQTGEEVEYVISTTAGMTYLACPADGGVFSLDPYMYLYTGPPNSISSLVAESNDTCG
jgi:hypothetical protein